MRHSHRSLMNLFLACVFLSAASLQSRAQGLQDMCGTGVCATYLPNESDYREAPTLVSQPVAFQPPADPCAATAHEAEVKRLHEAVKAAAIAAFSSSQWSLKVRIRFTLLPDKDAQFELKTAGDPKEAHDMLTDFYQRLAALKDYHSGKGLFYVM